MSFTPKQGPGSGQQSQQAKTLAGIQQQMQNLVHGQGSLSQAINSQPGLGAVNFANLNLSLQQQQQQQQRLETIIKQQQLLFSANTQIQHLQQMQQNAVNEPLALTRGPNDLLNKSLHHQQQQPANGAGAPKLATNLASQQIQQLHAFAQNPTNLMQQLQAYQYQMQQQQQQQHHQQKIMSHNQSQQPLNSSPYQSKNAAHMQRIQQSYQQQQKLITSHAKTLSAANPLKSLQAGSQTQQLQSNNNLPNSPVHSSPTSPAKQNQNSSKASAVTQVNKSSPSIQNSGKSTGTAPTNSNSKNVEQSIKSQVNVVSISKPLPNSTSSSSNKTTTTVTSLQKCESSSITEVKHTEDSTSEKSDNGKEKCLNNSELKNVSANSKTVASSLGVAEHSNEKSAEESLKKSNSNKGKQDEDRKDETEIKNGEKENEQTEEKLIDVPKVEEKSIVNESSKLPDKVLQKTEDLKDKKLQDGTVDTMENAELNTKSMEDKNESALAIEKEVKKEEITNNTKNDINDKTDIKKTPDKTEIIQQELVQEKKNHLKSSISVDVKTKENYSEKFNTNIDRRSKRHRLKTILYQSPLPELEFIAKVSASEVSNSPKNTEEKLTIFYKNEFLAVRNSEGRFYLCQTLQNVYKKSPKIRIRWLSEDKNEENVYIPDFYDVTDIECVLTTIEMEKLSKDRLKLSKVEQSRIENILQKAINVEKGITPRPDVTEENPDGLDISLYKNESQIEKKQKKRKSSIEPQPLKKMNNNKTNKIQKKKKKTVISKNDKNIDSNEDETESEIDNDKDYKPSKKKTAITQPKLRAQRSPLAKARAASPINIPIKQINTKSKPLTSEKKAVTPTVSKKELSENESTSSVNRANRLKRRTKESIDKIIEEDTQPQEISDESSKIPLQKNNSKEDDNKVHTPTDKNTKSNRSNSKTRALPITPTSSKKSKITSPATSTTVSSTSCSSNNESKKTNLVTSPATSGRITRHRK